MKKNVGVVTTSRADFGLLYPIIHKMENDDEFNVRVIATGIHLLKEYGYTLKYVREKCKIVDEVDLFMNNISKHTLIKSIGIGFLSFGDYFKLHNFDTIIVLGDRTELIVPVYSAMLCNIPVCHIFGGDSIDNYVTYDNNVRHCITKLANIHFTATKEHAYRIEKMGEEEWRIYNVGSPAIDYIKSCKYISKEKLSEKFSKINFHKPFCLLTFHPVPTEIDNIDSQIHNIIDSLKYYGIQTICTKPNNDLGSEIIMKKIKEQDFMDNNFLLVDSLSQEEFYSLFKYSSFMIGNSSSGILESSSFHIPTINIGTRQNGRIKSENIIDTGYSIGEIKKSILKCLVDEQFKEICSKCNNPYGDGKTSDKIVKILRTLLTDKKKLLIKKITY